MERSSNVRYTLGNITDISREALGVIFPIPSKYRANTERLLITPHKPRTISVRLWDCRAFPERFPRVSHPKQLPCDIFKTFKTFGPHIGMHRNASEPKGVPSASEITSSVLIVIPSAPSECHRNVIGMDKRTALRCLVRYV